MPPWKTFLLSLYYQGSRPYRRWWRGRVAAHGRLPVVVLFYHRIADDAANPWTVSNRMFERQIGWLESRFQLISLDEAQERIRSGVNTRPAVSITFDDGYAENCRRAIPLLVKRRIPCTYFVTVRNVLAGQSFDHDLAAGNQFDVNSLAQLRDMAAAGIEIGSHCDEHVDLATITQPRRLHREVVTAKTKLEQALERPVRYLAFPSGSAKTSTPGRSSSPEMPDSKPSAQPTAGTTFRGDDPFHLQRIHVDDDMIRLKNRATIDPRKLHTPRYEYRTPENPAAQPPALRSGNRHNQSTADR